jgi:hypothetical protein
MMAGHLLLAVFSLIVHFHAAYSVITAQQMLVAVAQFSHDFTWPRITQIACVFSGYHSKASYLTKA